MNNNYYKEIKLCDDLIAYINDDIGYYYYVLKDVYTVLDPIELLKVKYFALQIEFDDLKLRLETVEKILIDLTKDLRIVIPEKEEITE